MIDHVLGRPTPRYRKYQIFTVLLLWSILIRRWPHGPLPKASRLLNTRLTTWQAVVLTFMSEYIRRNFSRLVGLESPEPLANMYDKDYFRATWVTTALDAGFWSAMRLRPKWVRDAASMLFSAYYLVCAEQADEMVRRVRGRLTLEHLRVSWNKPNTPYLSFLTRLMRPKRLKIASKPRRCRIPRPSMSAYTEPIDAYMYYDGKIPGDMAHHDKLILDVPGGGFVAMDPKCHEDKLMAWAAKTGLPVLALDYKKAPEYPYPYALNECYDAYWQIIMTRGKCIGLEGLSVPKIVVSGDSAGGNLAAGLMLMLLQESPHIYSNRFRLPPPEALILVYPALDMNITSWLSDEQSRLMQDPARKKVNKGVLKSKEDEYRTLTNTPYPSDDEANTEGLRMTKRKPKTPSPSKGTPNGHPPFRTNSSVNFTTPLTPVPSRLPTRLETTSMIAYFNDRILSPEMLRAMIILYIGPNNRPDFTTDYLLSPLRAPDALLAQFPKTYFLTGERDPLCDDTVLFSGRLVQAHLQRWHERRELGLVPEDERFDDKAFVETLQVPRISHGFLQFVSVYPRGWRLIEQCSRWMKEAFAAAVAREAVSVASNGGEDYFGRVDESARRKVRRGSEDEDAGRPLEMGGSGLSMTKVHGGRRRGSRVMAGSSSMMGEGVAAALRKEVSGSGGGRGSTKVRKSTFSGRKSPEDLRKSRSWARLADSEELMGRRMDGLARGLMGGEEEDDG